MKTKTTLLLATIATLITCSVYGEDAIIPLKSQMLLQKLQKWESEEKAKFDARVNKKKQVVAGVLKTHLTEVTKKGDLKGANALQAQITKLTGEKAIVADSDTTPSDGEDDGYKLTIKNPTDEQLIEFFKNTTWEIYKTSGFHVYELRFDGLGEGIRLAVDRENGNDWPLVWKVEDEKVWWYSVEFKRWENMKFDQRKNTIFFTNAMFRKVKSKK